MREHEQHPFRALADRMQDRPELAVRIALNIKRAFKDQRVTPALVRAEAERLAELWPAGPRSTVYYRPSGPAPFTKTGDRWDDRACLHAKSIVVDGRVAFVTSANFSAAAHERNVELGIRIDDPDVAKAIEAELDRLVRDGVLSLLDL